MIKRTLLYVVVLLILLAVALMAGQQDGNDALLQQYSSDISSWATAQEQAARNWVQKSNNNRLGSAEQHQEVYTVLTHRSDSLIAWSNTRIIPAPQDLKKMAGTTGRSLVALPAGWFLAQVTPQGSEVTTILIPLRYALDGRDDDTGGAFPADRRIPGHLQLLTTATEWPIMVDGKAYAWLNADGPIQSGWLSWVKLGAWVLFFLTLFALLNQLARALSARVGALAGATTLLLVIGGLVGWNQQTGWTTTQFGALSLFQPAFEGASLMGRSVGDWLIQVALLVFLMAFFHRSYRARPLTHLPEGVRLGIALFSQVLALLGIPIAVLVVRQLVFQNLLGFDFDNILSIGTAGFLSLTGFIGLLVGFFLFGHRLALTQRSLELSRVQRWGVIAVATVAIACIAIPMGADPVFVALFALLYAVAMDAFVHWEGNGFGWVVLWLLWFSLFAATLLSRYNTENDRAQRLAYAKALVSARDTASAEYLLPEYLKAIQQDSGDISQVLKPWPFKAHQEDLRTQLNSIALQFPYLFQHYRLTVAAFDQESQPVLMGQSLGFQEVVRDNWDAAKPLPNYNDIRFLTGADGKFRYMLRFLLTRAVDITQRAQVYVFLDHEHPAPTRAFTQIFYHTPYKDLQHLARYQFAVQQNGRILVEQGRGSLAALSAEVANGAAINLVSSESSRVDAVAKSADGQTIASVGHTSGGWLKNIYLFSIFFTLASLLLLALAFANSWLRFLPEEYDFRLTAKGSLARRIHLWNVSLLAASFMIVGFLTYRHFTGTARESAETAFNYRAEALQNNLEAPFLNVTDSTAAQVQERLTGSLQSITTSLAADANFYGPNGVLLFTTQKDLAALGVVPARMNVEARALLTQGNLTEITSVEQAGGHVYNSQYRTCRNGRGALLGFLSVPSPAGQEKIGSDVSDFIGMLASLYVFLLLIAYVITYALSRSIIKPLRLLSEKVQELKLEDKNAPLEYAGDAQDEISELIVQYNSMVHKLEASKVQLVRLEREGAWREMAKQVAHDIKNPLTTMKLSMQQLERVSNNPEQAAAYLRKAITRLIEQIDSLAQIASEFSMFANLDIRNKNDVIINEVVESVHDLFSEQKNVQLELTLPKEIYHILGDKNHLIRVFNNLVINAIQSIPSDRQGHVMVSLVRHDKLSVVKISDNGGGIPPEIGERVFEPNFTTKTSGSGLGLAICKKIIEAHDGTIRFETRENEGTDFFVEIPVTAVG